jgi:hypothetical protein
MWRGGLAAQYLGTLFVSLDQICSAQYSKKNLAREEGPKADTLERRDLCVVSM